MEILYTSTVLGHPGNEVENPERLSGLQSYPETPLDLEGAEEAIRALYSGGARMSLEKLRRMCAYKSEVADVQLDPASINAIIASVSLAISAAKTGGFAVTRPPGHHASLDRPSGFCLLNNLAIAVNQLLSEGKKVAIIDFDGHHGDGTESIFRNNENVLLCSCYQAQGFGSPIRRKISNAVNIGLPLGSGDEEFLTTIQSFLNRIGNWGADVIGVSAGFDAHIKDPLLALNLTTGAFEKCGQLIGSMKIPTFATLEGGYHSDVVECIEKFVQGFNITNS